MKLKVIMDSGKEYITAEYFTVERLLDTAVDNAKNVVFHPLDSEKRIWINGNRISSVERVD